MFNLQKEALRAIVVTCSRLPNTNVIWSRQARPYVGPKMTVDSPSVGVMTGLLVLKPSTDIETGFPEERADETALPGRTVTSITRGKIIITARMTQLDSSEGLDTLRLLRKRLRQPAALRALRTAGLAFLNSGSIIDLKPVFIDDKGHVESIWEFTLGYALGDDVTADYSAGTTPAGTDTWIQSTDPIHKT